MSWRSFENIIWIIPVLIIILLSINVYKWRERVINSFADERLIGKIFTYTSSRRHIIRIFLTCLSLFFIVLALMDPLFGYKDVKIKREGVDIVFLLDLSQSMDAQDIAPSRLEKSNKLVNEMLNSLAGDRVSLVIFAGDAYSILPLTSDYASLQNYLENIDTSLISNQGTNYKNALEKASELLQNSGESSKLVVMISDGEDNEESTSQAIEIANNHSIHVMAVGVGTKKGAPIPLKRDFNNNIDSYKKDRSGNVVITKLEEDNLKKIASSTRGIYLKLGNIKAGISDLLNYKSKLIKSEISNTTTKDMNHIYQWFLMVAIALLIIELLTSLYKIPK